MTAALFSPHLHPGERIVWSASVSEPMVRASLNRKRLIAGVTGAAGAVLTFFLAVRALESFFPPQAPEGFTMNVFGPIYAAFAVAMAVYTYGCFSRLNPQPPEAAHFAATDRRLIALAADGAIVRELPGAEIESVNAAEISRHPALYVARRDDAGEDGGILIPFIDRPLEAKAIIEETFLEPAPPETTP